MSPINRRQWLKTVGTLGLGSFLPAQPRQTSTSPNVLLIVCDDLNDWCLGYHPDVKTPHIDRLIQRGTLFANAYSAGIRCNPSRTSFLSGLYPSSTGIYENNVDFRLAPRLKNHQMLPEYFAQHGYKTFGSGKFSHLKQPAMWNESFNLHPDNAVRGLDIPPLFSQGNKNGINIRTVAIPRFIDWAGLDRPDSDWLDWKNTEWVRELLETTHEQPFFIGLGLYRTHTPHYAPQHYLDALPPQVRLPRSLQNDLGDVPAVAVPIRGVETFAYIKEHSMWETLVRHYIACIHYVDMRIGEILDALDASPHAENTIVLLWSDHGKMLGEKDYFGKGVFWDAGLHIPLVLAGAGIPTGTRIEAPVSLVDMHQTLIELCGLPRRTDTDSHSLMRLIQNPTMTWDKPVLSVRNPGEYTLRSAEWRYSRYPDSSEELYAHPADDKEWDNLALEDNYQGFKDGFRHLFPTDPQPSIILGGDNDD